MVRPQLALPCVQENELKVQTGPKHEHVAEELDLSDATRGQRVTHGHQTHGLVAGLEQRQVQHALAHFQVAAAVDDLRGETAAPLSLYSIKRSGPRERAKVTDLISAAGQACIPLGKDTLHPQEEGALQLIVCRRKAHHRGRKYREHSSYKENESAKSLSFGSETCRREESHPPGMRKALTCCREFLSKSK